MINNATAKRLVVFWSHVRAASASNSVNADVNPAPSRTIGVGLAAALALGCDRRPSKGPSGAFRTAQTTTEVAAAAKPSVAALTLVDKAGKNCGAGTGFFIEGGRLVTNWHVAGLGRGGPGRFRGPLGGGSQEPPRTPGLNG